MVPRFIPSRISIRCRTDIKRLVILIAKMSTPVQNAVSAAFKLFSRQNYKAITSDSLKEIINNFNQVTKAELQINPAILADKIPGHDEPPVTYIRIHENKVNMSQCMTV